MLLVTHLTSFVLGLIGLVQSAPTHLNYLDARRLLGSSFGLPGANQTFDYVVLGGGNAGLTIATRLAETATVAVIEAGSFYEISNSNISQIPLFDYYFTGKDKDDFNPLIDWGFQTTPQAVGQELLQSEFSLMILPGSTEWIRACCSGEMSWRKLCSQFHGLPTRNDRFIQAMGRSSWRSKLYFREILAIFRKESEFHSTGSDQTCSECHSTVWFVDSWKWQRTSICYVRQLCPGLFFMGAERSGRDRDSSNQWIHKWQTYRVLVLYQHHRTLDNDSRVIRDGFLGARIEKP